MVRSRAVLTGASFLREVPNASVASSAGLRQSQTGERHFDWIFAARRRAQLAPQLVHNVWSGLYSRRALATNHRRPRVLSMSPGIAPDTLPVQPVLHSVAVADTTPALLVVDD